MIRIAKKTDPKKLEDLKKKVNDPEYMTVAISRIALTITDEILQLKEEESV